MRERQTGRLLLNAVLFPEMKLDARREDKSFNFSCVNVAAAPDYKRKADGADDEETEREAAERARSALRTYGVRVRGNNAAELLETLTGAIEAHKGKREGAAGEGAGGDAAGGDGADEAAGADAV